MSQKISNKNLHYDSSLPPFLARLKNQHTATIGDGPDPLLAAHRRPTKPRDQADIDEDAPVIVDEEGNVVAAGTMSVGVDGTVTKTAKGEAAADKEKEDEEGEKEGEEEKEKENNGGMIGGKRKRKVGKVIGVDEEEEETTTTTKSATKSKRTDDGSKVTNSAKTDAEAKEKDKAKNGAASKGKKKAKKIKLSFGDGDDGD